MTNAKATHNAFRVLTMDSLKGEAERTADSSTPEQFRAWAVGKMEPVDLERFCPPDEVNWTEVHRRFVTRYAPDLAEETDSQRPLSLPDATPERFERVKRFQSQDPTDEATSDYLEQAENPKGPGPQSERDTFFEVAIDGDDYAHAWNEGDPLTYCGQKPVAILAGEHYLGIWCPGCHGHLGHN